MYSKIYVKDSAFVVLELISKVIAYAVCIQLLLASLIITYNTFIAIFSNQVSAAIQDGLFVLILLEMFYVTRSFIKYGTINVSIVINVGLIAAVKQLIFELDSISMQTAIGFGVLFLSLSCTFYLEKIFFKEVTKAKMEAKKLVIE